MDDGEKDTIDAIQKAIDSGDPGQAERLLPLVYDELRKLAHGLVRREGAGNSLHTTALVHEAYLRLYNAKEEPDWKGRGHFFSAAAQSMRHILVDRARTRGSVKRGGKVRRLDLADFSDLSADEVPVEIIDLDEALKRFEVEHREKAELVSLRFFAGLTLKQAAAVLGIGDSTADRHWHFARAWLIAAMDGEL